MPNPNKVFRSSLSTGDSNYIFLLMIIIATLGSVFLAWKEVQAGVIYVIMVLATISILFLVQWWVKDDNRMGGITEYLKIPISTRTTTASIMFLLGTLTPLVLQLFLSLARTSYNVSQLSIPVFGVNINNAFQSFATAEIGSSMSWRLFSIVFVAGTIETFVYNFGVVILGALFGLLLWRLYDKDDKGTFKKGFVIITGIIISVLLFMISHQLNGSYTGQAFLIAGIFLFVANISIYFGGMFLLFWVGYHQMNNLLYLIQIEGINAVLSGFLSWFGVFYFLLLGGMIWFLLNHKKKLKMDWKRWFNA